MANISLKLFADTAAVSEFLDELSSLAANCPAELVQSFADRVINLVEQGFAFDFDRATTSTTDNLIVRLVPTDAMLGLVAAARAGDFQFNAFAHVASSDVAAKHDAMPLDKGAA